MPTPTTYNYTISTDTANGKVFQSDLEKEITGSSIVIALDYVLSSGDSLDIHFKDVLSTADETSLTALVAAHQGNDLGVVDSFLVRVQEQDDNPAKQVRGGYRGIGLVHNVPASVGWSHTDYTFPYDIAMLDMEYTPTTDQQGDYFSVCVAPETVIGAITSDVAINDTVINVSSTVIENLAEGFCFEIWDGTNLSDCEAVIAGGIDPIAGTVSVAVGAQHAFAAATPSYIRMDVPVVEHVYLIGTSRVELGSSKIGGSFVPAGTAIRFRYYNVDGLAKTFHGILEVLY